MKEEFNYMYKYSLTETLSFGKHKGETIRNIIVNDLSYITWLYYQVEFAFDLTKEAFRAMEFMIDRITKRND